MDPGNHPDFEQHWRQISVVVMAFCLKMAGDRHVAEEAFAETSSRAWRHFRKFRNESSFQTYVITIASREVARIRDKQRRERSRAVSFDKNLHDNVASRATVEPHQSSPPATAKFVGDSADAPPVVANQETPSSAATWILQISIAHREGFLSSAQTGVLQARLISPDSDWAAMAAQLKMPSSAPAVHHCRGIQRFRVFCLLKAPELLGGLDAIREGYHRAEPELTPHERILFRDAVLSAKPPRQRLGDPFRKACAKVLRHMTPPNA